MLVSRVRSHADADAGVIEDARFKRKEALAGLAQAVKA